MSKRHQMNLSFEENDFDNKGGFNHQPPIVVNVFSQQSGGRPLKPNKPQRSLSLGSSEFDNYPFSPYSKRIKGGKRQKNNEESKLKSFFADQLMEFIASEQLNLNLASYKTNIGLEKLIDLSKGNISRVSLYELLRGLTSFGCEARICLRPTLNQLPGEVIPDI